MTKVICCRDSGGDCNWVYRGEDCTWTGRADTKEELLIKVNEHVKKDHGLPELTPALLEKVRAIIKDE